ncbi:C2 calcium-dependent membrane targeting [Gossypium australe]|uniref:C2 calcium-dependent membrane targeting n=1 Tax=Gossypium australe TaxID=47621 RepID=A0A5B6U5Y9_9ROSI|nr:C2 calcium-dependent membrane targeting [Gossypium australe]
MPHKIYERELWKKEKDLKDPKRKREGSKIKAATSENEYFVEEKKQTWGWKLCCARDRMIQHLHKLSALKSPTPTAVHQLQLPFEVSPLRNYFILVLLVLAAAGDLGVSAAQIGKVCGALVIAVVRQRVRSSNTRDGGDCYF